MPETSKEDKSSELDRLANEEHQSILEEFWSFLKHNKKWWLLPIVIAILLLGLFVFLGGTAIAPFIYPLF